MKNADGSVRAGIYHRVSTEEQVGGYSLARDGEGTER